jgi:hypothetical protein
MVNNIKYTNVRVILDRLLRHPLLQELNLEAAIQYTLDFISIVGLPNIYIDKIETVDIKDYRGQLPCDLIAINQVRLHSNGACIRSMTGNFNACPIGDVHNTPQNSETTFKVQGSMIYTSQREAQLDISYKAIMMDGEGYPLIPDDPVFLNALELFIKKEFFTILFDLGKIAPAVLQNTEQKYAFRVGQCHNRFVMPSVSEMETLTNILNRLIPSTNEFRRGFKSLGDKEYLRVH